MAAGGLANLAMAEANHPRFMAAEGVATLVAISERLLLMLGGWRGQGEGPEAPQADASSALKDGLATLRLAVGALANLSGSAPLRGDLLRQGALGVLVRVTQECRSLEVIAQAARGLSNLVEPPSPSAAPLQHAAHADAVRRYVAEGALVDAVLLATNANAVLARHAVLILAHVSRSGRDSAKVVLDEGGARTLLGVVLPEPTQAVHHATDVRVAAARALKAIASCGVPAESAINALADGQPWKATVEAITAAADAA